LKIAPDLYDITVFGAEPHPNYNRILLSPVLAGEQTIDQIILNPLSWYVEQGIALHLSKRVAKIDRVRRQVVADDGTVADYDRLLIATGSLPFVLPVPGKDLLGVMAYRDIADTQTMIETAKTHRHAVVIGGGLLGLEAADGLMQGHRDLANAGHRAEVAALWGLPSVPDKPGKSAIEMFQAAADGEIKALWIACTNPAQSLPDQATVRRALERAELVVVQEAFATTATARYADWLLPATSWGEKDGTVTNSERCISRVRPAVPAPGQTRHDWSIAVALAQRLEARLRPGAATLFPYTTAESVWLEHRESTRGRDLDITGLSYPMLDTRGPQQWPLRAGDRSGRARLYEDGRFETDDGRAHFFDTPYVALAEPRDARFPFSLTTGRLRDQWHGMSRTGTLGRLFGHQAEPTIDLAPQDMARLGLQDGDLTQLASRRGSLVLPARASDTVAPTQAHVAMHWGDEVLGGQAADDSAAAGINTLTNPAYCPTSKQPELKHSAIRLQKAALPWHRVAVAWLSEAAALALRQQLAPVMRGFGYASCVPFGHAEHGLLLRLAATAAPTPEAVTGIESLFGLVAGQPQVLRYADRQRGQRRAIGLQRTGDDAQLRAFVLAGDTRAEGWIKALLL
jgi:assimilatory nitrate reductase catalytic subunit